MVTGGLSPIDGIDYYRIEGVEHMAPFLMSVVSSTDLWMFISSTGTLTAGRVDANRSLFPYETDDRLHRAAGSTGPVTVIARTCDGRRELWRPFAAECDADGTRSIAKSVLGDRVLFEEFHRGWQLRFRATWEPSSTYGWVRTVELADLSGTGAELEVLDGLLDVMPAGVDARTEESLSNLADSYKRSQAGPWGTLAVYTIEALITDRPEPAESLTATTVWSTGFHGDIDLDEGAVGAMVAGRPSQPSLLVTGNAGAYVLRGRITIPESGSRSWLMVADTGLTHAEVVAATHAAADPNAAHLVSTDVRAGSAELHELLTRADAFQSTADNIADAHHLSNVLFNSMRGGVFPHDHRVPASDLAAFVRSRNHAVSDRNHDWFQSLNSWVDVAALRTSALASTDPDLIRLVLEYLPLTFSRRHGDPSRPWNHFSINVRNEAGGEVLEYEGNWRDIFQNWEALLRSFPGYYANVIAKFVNASTLDGHNAYRISRKGIDWEVPDPDDPWSHIGYWGDHQIVYLLRLLEAWDAHEPGAIREWLRRPVFTYADVPYAIADHDAMVRDPQNTIDFDEAHAEEVARRERQIGSDGRLVVKVDDTLLRVGLLEKLLVPALAKLSNFVPQGGIWMNTQRPEWNDANNALAGTGVSMVTLYHLHRYLQFLRSQLDTVQDQSVELTSSVHDWFIGMFAAYEQSQPPADDRSRRTMLDTVSRLATEHRTRIRQGIDESMRQVSTADIRRLCQVAADHLMDSIRAAQRPDGLYHSYNRISFVGAAEAQLEHLDLMLEGQVAVLSSGVLAPDASLDLLDALFASALYRPDQKTFTLYPPRELPSFLERNVVPSSSIDNLDLDLEGSVEQIFVPDMDGTVRFQADIINAVALVERLDQLGLGQDSRRKITELYEDVFDHQAFTGRSGSMYGYEGIGSIYWHMVAKLLLAVQEIYFTALEQGAPPGQIERLAETYRKVRSGLGFQKSPAEFGALPTDCYSHTPAHRGAQQPGMTGQVKEEVLTRFGELGVQVRNGCITLSPGLLDLSEVVPSALNSGDAESATFTFCSVPMTIRRGPVNGVKIVARDGTSEHRDRLALTRSDSQKLFARTGGISGVEWTIGATSS